MSCMFRLMLLMVEFTGLAMITALNVYADYKEQLIISLLIFSIAYIAGTLYFKTEFKPNWQFLTLFACMFFISVFAYGFGGICLLKQFEWGTTLVEDIATYQLVTKFALNLTSGILMTISGFLFGKVSVGPEPEEYF